MKTRGVDLCLRERGLEVQPAHSRQAYVNDHAARIPEPPIAQQIGRRGKCLHPQTIRLKQAAQGFNAKDHLGTTDISRDCNRPGFRHSGQLPPDILQFWCCLHPGHLLPFDSSLKRTLRCPAFDSDCPCRDGAGPKMSY